jgi:hypothetical protein
MREEPLSRLAFINLSSKIPKADLQTIAFNTSPSLLIPVRMVSSSTLE